MIFFQVKIDVALIVTDVYSLFTRITEIQNELAAQIQSDFEENLSADAKKKVNFEIW